MPRDSNGDADRLVIDFGAHLQPTIDKDNPVFTDIDVAHERFTDGGIDGAVLSSSRHIGSEDVEATRRANDRLLELVSEREHYYMLAALPSGAGGDAAAAELERCLENGANGGVVQTEANGVRATADEMEGVYEVANEAAAPVMVHPKIHDALGPDVLDDDYLMNKVFGREVALCDTLVRMIHDGILERNQDFTPVVHHTAGNIASMYGRIRGSMIDRDLDHLKSFEEFAAQLRDRVHLDTSGYFGDENAYRNALELFSASNMMLASDYPYEAEEGEDFRAVIEGIEAVTSESEADDVLGQNAVDLLVNTD